jgi:hypothetical protein
MATEAGKPCQQKLVISAMLYNPLMIHHSPMKISIGILR